MGEGYAEGNWGAGRCFSPLHPGEMSESTG